MLMKGFLVDCKKGTPVNPENIKLAPGMVVTFEGPAKKNMDPQKWYDTYRDSFTSLEGQGKITLTRTFVITTFNHNGKDSLVGVALFAPAFDKEIMFAESGNILSYVKLDPIKYPKTLGFKPSFFTGSLLSGVYRCLGDSEKNRLFELKFTTSEENTNF